MQEQIYSRVQILLQQNRYDEARVILENHLAQYPEDSMALYFMAIVYLEKGEKDKCRKLTEKLLEDAPDVPMFIHLSAAVDLADEKLEAAESKAELLISLQPEEGLGYLLMGKIKMRQNNYDKALFFADKALRQNAEDVEAYNLKILIESLLGKETTDESIAKALHLNPEDASTIANQGLQMLRKGQVNEAIERLRYALSVDPTNTMARYAMEEALKNKFFLYRLFFRYKNAMALLSGKGSWGVIIGAYIIYQILRRIAENNPSLQPYLYPIIFIIFGIFIMTWVIDPLMNLYLLANKYGKLLLDKDQKTMAQLTGGALAVFLMSLTLYFIMDADIFVQLSILSFAMMIPLGSFLNPVSEKNKKRMTLYTTVVGVIGAIGIFLGFNTLFIIALLGIFIYQWVINGIMIKENSRVFD